MSEYTVQWSKPANHGRTERIIVLSEARIRYEFDDGTASEYDTENAHHASVEWVARCRSKGALVTAQGETT